MATAVDSEKVQVCPVCADHYKEPRKLPGCIHSFCEACILNIVLNLQKEDKLGHEFECPVCRLPSKSPDDGHITLEWKQTMEKDPKIETTIENETEEYTLECCSQCNYQQQKVAPKYYCTTCQDCFCESCSQALHSFKINKGHTLIGLTDKSHTDDIHEKAVRLVKKFLSCSNHPDKTVELHCEDENKFFCALCVPVCHQNCENVRTIKALSETRDKTADTQFINSQSVLANHIQAIIGVIKETDIETKKYPDILCSEFQEMKQKVVRLLDIIEEKITLETKAITKALSIKHLDEIQELNNISSDLRVVTYLSKKLLDKLQPAHAAVCVQEARKLFELLETKVVERGPVLDTENVLLKTERSFYTILDVGPNETEHIMSIQRTRKALLVPAYDRRPLLRACRINKICEKNVVAEDRPDLDPRFNGILFLEDNRAVLTDCYHGICCLVDQNLKLVDSMDFEVDEVTDGCVSDINFIYPSYTKNGLIAVSISANKSICFLAAGEELEKKCEITCRFTPNAIHVLRNDDIAVLWSNPTAVGIITLKGWSYKDRVYFTKDSEGRRLLYSRRMAVDEDRSHIILTCKADKTVYCYDFDANRIFAYKNKDVKDPRGVNLDGDGNIYFCEGKKGSIVVLSPDGTLVRVIREECPAHPLAIGFMRDKNCFAVSQFNPRYKAICFYSMQPEEKRLD